LGKFLKRSVVRGKIVKVGWLFQGTRVGGVSGEVKETRVAGVIHKHPAGVFQPNLAEFCARVTVTEGTVTSMVNGVQIEFDAQTLGDILGVPAADFDLYVREDKSLLGKAKLLDLASG